MATRLIRNAVIGGGSVDADFNSPVGQAQTFTIPVGTVLSAVWYNAVDNLGDYLAFDHIDVAPSGQDVLLTIKPNRNALLRLYIYGE
jgi:hypothetical protein